MRRAALPALLATLLSACTTAPVAPVDRLAGPAPAHERDGYPDAPPDVSLIEDPVPRQEPRSRYGNPPTYEVFGERYAVMESADGFVERGIASWYGTKFHGRRTSSGEPYDMYAMTAAHKSLPLPSYVQVTNLANGKQVVVRVNDRGPFSKSRVIDLSYAAAWKLDVLGPGTAPVEIRVLQGPAPAAPVVTAQAAPAVQPTVIPAATDAAAVTSRTVATPIAEPKPIAAVDKAAVRYFIQVGAFSDAVNAEQLQRKLNDAGLAAPARVEMAALPQGTLYRVRVGPVTSTEQVDRLTADLDKMGMNATRVVVQD